VVARGSGAFRRVILFEATAALLFFGILGHHPQLEQCGAKALAELTARGYETPSGSDPVRIYPAATAGSFSSIHAGGWRPGVISLRENPQGNVSAEAVLRHELMHEASFRTCSGKLPWWAEEAAAIGFSGELAVQAVTGPPAANELEPLRRRIRIGAGLDQAGYQALSRLVAAHGWPQQPCALSAEIQQLLSPAGGSGETGFSAVLIHLLSGRVLEAQGDLKTRHPPGSLLKVPYAAALTDAPGAALGQ
jgi:hypothetical protein